MNEPALIADASAVVAMLMNEPFGDLDPDYLIGSTISSVNLSEVLTKLIDLGFSEEQAQDSVSTINLRVLPFGETDARSAAGLRPSTRRAGLSLADRACLALGLALKRPVVTGDRVWATLDVGVEVVLIR